MSHYHIILNLKPRENSVLILHCTFDRMGLISDGARWGDIGWSKMGSSKEPPDYELEPTDQEAGKARYTGQSVLLGVDARFVNISDFNVQPPLGCPSIEFHGEAQDVSIKCLNYLAGKDFMFELPSTDLAYHYRSKNLANRKDLSLTLCAREKTTTYPQFFSIEGSKIFVKKEKFRDPPIPSLVAALCLEIFPSQLYSIIQWTENGLSTCRARKFTTVRVVRR